MVSFAVQKVFTFDEVPFVYFCFLFHVRKTFSCYVFKYVPRPFLLLGLLWIISAFDVLEVSQTVLISFSFFFFLLLFGKPELRFCWLKSKFNSLWCSSSASNISFCLWLYHSLWTYFLVNIYLTAWIWQTFWNETNIFNHCYILKGPVI